MNDQPCQKNNPRWVYPCSCVACSRAAARAWTGLMDRVFAGNITLTEANLITDSTK